MSANNERLGEGLRIYTAAMRVWLARTLRRAQGGRGDWFADRVLVRVSPQQRASLENAVSYGRVDPEFRVESVIEPNHMRAIVNGNWRDGCGAAFQGKQVASSWIQEVGDVRNLWAHGGIDDEEQVRRALDTCVQVLGYVDKQAAERVKRLRDGEAPEPTAPQPEPEPAPVEEAPAALRFTPSADLRSWRDVIQPHADVQGGKFQQAEFAADLHQVMRGAAAPEYQNAEEFFRRTHITNSMQALLTNVVRRLRSGDGDPVIDLRTAFGGGKTHTLLAVLHMLRHPRTRRMHEKLAQIHKDAGGPPPLAKVAVLVGTELNPETASRSAEETGGEPIHSFWGELAWQLAGREGFELVKQFDSPGAGAPIGQIDRLFELAAPAVVLIDELVAYLRNVDAMGGGAYNAHLSFFQHLTQAAARNPKVTVLVTIPQSTIEVGDVRGEEITQQVANIFQRVGAPWQPLDYHEAFEVVRRRLFGEKVDEAERDRTCASFAEMYTGSHDFPAEAREPAYEERMRQCYPLHPEIFDRLYIDWAGNVDRFQRTRGVLKLMADCIYRLWSSLDPWPLITPGSLPIGHSAVKQQMIGYLSDQWNSPIDGDIDGENSEAAKMERAATRYGQTQVCRRLTRTVFLGSAAKAKAEGIEISRVLLGAAQPGESPALYSEALRALAAQLSFLHAEGERYRFDTKPTLNKMAMDRLSRVTREQAEDVLSERLRNSAVFRERGAFARVHIAPRSGADVVDEPTARLVILPPEMGYQRETDAASAATEQAKSILDSRGASTRTHQNMLAFLAAGAADVDKAIEQVRKFIVWDKIAQEGSNETLLLDRAQQKQAEESRDEHDSRVNLLLLEAYRWLFAPRIPAENPTGEIEIEWNAQLLPNDAGSGPALRAAKQMDGDGALITQWAPLHLKKLLDDLLWQENDHVSLRKVWEDLTKYLYMPRLRDEQVLLETVRQGARSRDFFGYAQGVDDHGKYLGLVFGDLPPIVVADGSSLLVRPEAAALQVAPEAKPDEPEVVDPPPGTDEPPEPALPKRFFGTITLNQDRMARDANQVITEVVERIAAVEGAQVSVSIEIEVEVDASEGFDDAVQRTISENAAALGFKQASFEER